MTTVRELEPADAPALTELYEEYPWWDDREAGDVSAALANTEVALGVVESAAAESTDRATDGEATLVAAARVLTDYRYYATVYDVIVAADRRGEGLGEQLMDAVAAHPALQELPGLSLHCRDGLVPFYESVGFELFNPEIDVPEGGTEELVRMTYQHAE